MKNILLKIEYDGTDFSGWQRQPQPHIQTVQGRLELALFRLCGRPVRLEGTGRTDAGVHALGQCATFSTDLAIPTDRLAKALNDILAESRIKDGAIRIISAREVAPDFHARFSAAGKTYVYRIYNAESMPVFLRSYRYHVRQPLDIDAMKKAAAAFPGRRDFKAFMAAGSTPQETTVRTIYGLYVEACSPHHQARTADTSVRPDDPDRQPVELSISVTGDGFLYNMVRIIAGTLVDVGLGRLAWTDVAGIIAGCDRQGAGQTAPPQGLYMAEVYFDRELMIKKAAGPWLV